ncbi:MAG: sigma-54-dependent Fis family transcriptional regulator [Deltaproteobacteria bacterium]|nr:sigma-54-dependent Fis family transcriptional regulator [Deltaproteobacteria bacterium]
MNKILVVDDEEGIRSFIAAALASKELRITTAKDGQEAAELLDRQSFHLVITDLKMPRLDGMALLQKIRKETPETEVIVLTAFGTIETAVAAMRLGALDYLAKPISSPDELRLLVQRALETRSLRTERDRHKRNQQENSPANFVARDPTMLAIQSQIDKVANTDAIILLSGESGTGKEITARAIHAASKRNAGPFVAVNCAAITESLLESEIFGHEKGAFTGATDTRRGRFELADGGTLFLDEVGELAPKLQAKLLRVLEEQTFERVGGTRAISVDTRVIAATNRNLMHEVEQQHFRLDLYHRLAVFPITLPPLRDRQLDIIPIALHLLSRIAIELGRPQLTLSKTAQQAIQKHNWPGNIRELKNVLERASIIADHDEIISKDLSNLTNTTTEPSLKNKLGPRPLREVEREAIIKALDATDGHRKQAAELLGIGLRTLYDKIKEYKL